MPKPAGQPPARVPPAKSREAPPAPAPDDGPKTGDRPLRVILADDHPIVRAGLRSVLERGGIEVIAEAADGRALLRQVVAWEPDVVVMDVSMPELNGIDAARAIRRQVPTARILMLSIHCTEDTVFDAVEAGATGYILKEAAPEELRRAVTAVAANEAYFSPAVARLLTNRISERATGRAVSPLSTREREVVQLIAEGHPLREVAGKLFISPQTVKTHRANALKKVGGRTTADLVRYALSHGLIAR